VQRWTDQAEIARRTGIVIPAYFSAKPTDDVVRHLLRMTLWDCPRYLPLEQVCVVVDGDERTAGLLDELREALRREQGGTFELVSLPENRGKLWAIAVGIRSLLERLPQVTYLVIRDGDGDHDMAEVPGLVRTALYLSEARGDTRVIAVGSRKSRHHPMGWVRGELETLLDAVTLDALAYALARQGRALDLSNCLIGAGVPDLSSGFKVYGREVAQSLFADSEPRMASLSESDYWHYGPETVTIVEAMLAGCGLGEKLRLTWDGQPTTSFGEFRHQSLYGELLAYVFTRLEIPLDVAAQLMDNHVPSLALRTTAQGQALLAELRSYALERVRAFRGDTAPLPAASSPLPFL
jgi:hypothetical protein